MPVQLKRNMIVYSNALVFMASIWMAQLLGSSLRRTKSATLLSTPGITVGDPSAFKVSVTTLFGVTVPGGGRFFELLSKPGVLIAPATDAITSTPFSFNSNQSPSASIVLKALLAAYATTLGVP